MATMLHQYGTTTRRGTQFDLRSPLRAAANAIMRAAAIANGTNISAERAQEHEALLREDARVHASVAGERYHNVV
jgi:hypothetical protein